MSTGASLSSALSKSVATLNLMATRLQSLHAQDGLLILRHSFSTPSIQHLLRGMLCCEHAMLEEYDLLLRRTVCRILNCNLDDTAWLQASLPVSSGGLGVRSAVQLSASCFLASVYGADSLVSAISRGTSLISSDPLVSQAFRFWCNLVGGSSNPLPPDSPTLQKSWDTPVITGTYESLLIAAPDEYSKARLLAVASPHSGDWLNCIPASTLGLHLDNEGIRIAIGLRLGTNICSPFQCVCGTMVDARGAHGLSCVKSAGRQLRHSLVNDVLLRALSRAKVPATKEPAGLVLGTALRPDGVTVIPWSDGRCLAWDVTCPDTVAASHVARSASAAGATADHAASLKHQKYQQLASSHTFIPVAIETFGSFGEEAIAFINSLGGRIISTIGDPRERMFLFQRLAMAVQRGNIACFTGSLHHDLFHSDPD